MGFGRIFLFIFVFAFVEVMVLAQVAEYTGWLFTIAATVFTAMLGSLLFRLQGLETWIRLNQRMQQGEMPGVELVEGFMLLMGGALLITPGFITDAIGFVLLLPPTRKAMARAMVTKGMMKAFTTRPGGAGAFVFTQRAYRTGPHPGGTPGGEAGQRPPVQETADGHLIIEGEAKRKDD